VPDALFSQWLRSANPGAHNDVFEPVEPVTMSWIMSLRSLLVVIVLAYAAHAGETELVLQDGHDGYRGTRDTAISVDPRLADRNLGAEPTIWIWQFDGVLLVKFAFDYSVIPSDAVVKQATLELYCTSVGFAEEEVQRPWDVGVYEFLADWREGSGDTKADFRDGATLKTWNGREGWPKGSPTALAGKLLGTTTLKGPESRWYKWSLDPALVTSWIAARRANHGFLVWGKAPGKAVAFASRENKSISQRPALRLRLEGIDGQYKGSETRRFERDKIIDLPNKSVGVWYTPFYTLKNDHVNHWDTDVKGWNHPLPLGGMYDCEDVETIRRQTKEMKRIGINFIVFDDNNCVHVDEGWIDRRIKAWFDFMDKEPEKDRLTLVISAGGELNVHEDREGWIKAVNYLWDTYSQRASYGKLDGKPLLIWYTERDVWPDWKDERWTVKQAFHYYRTKEQGTHGGWGWGANPFPPDNKECMSLMPGWHRGDNTDPISREGGAYYARQWRHVLHVKPRFVLIAGWNDLSECTAIEPTKAWGTQYVDSTRRYISLYRSR
jgi:hypothetical protein